MVPEFDISLERPWIAAEIANIHPDVATSTGDTIQCTTAYATASAVQWEPIWSTSWRVETPGPELWNTVLIPEDEVEIDPDELDSVLEECG